MTRGNADIDTAARRETLVGVCVGVCVSLRGWVSVCACACARVRMCVCVHACFARMLWRVRSSPLATVAVDVEF